MSLTTPKIILAWIEQHPSCEVQLLLLRSEIPSGMCAELRTVAASNNRVHRRDHSIIACSRHLHNGVILHAHPVRGESHNQRNTTGEIATTSPPFYNEPHRSHVLCVKAELRTTFTSWSQHHFVAIRYPDFCIDCMIHHERDVHEEQHHIYVARTSNNRVIMACELYRCLLPQCEALRICRSGFPIATQSTQHHQRCCNSTYWSHHAVLRLQSELQLWISFTANSSGMLE